MSISAVVHGVKIIAESLSLLISAVNLVMEKFKDWKSEDCECERKKLEECGVLFDDSNIEKPEEC